MQPTQPAPAPHVHEGQQLRDYLRFHGITYQYLAQRLGMAASNMSWLTKRARLSFKHREAVLGALDITYEAFTQPFPLPPAGEGQALKAYLKRHRRPVNWLATQLGIKSSSVSGYFLTQTFDLTTRQAILRVLGTSYEQVFATGEPVTTPAPAPLPIPIPPPTPDALSLARRQLAEWQALAQALAEASAPATQRSFCQYQIWHLELSLPALGLSAPLPAQPPLETQPNEPESVQS